MENNTIIDSEGNERTQRDISIDDKPARARPRKGARIRVYNKRRSKVFTSDGFLDAESEGEILASDMKIPGIRDNVIKIA